MGWFSDAASAIGNVFSGSDWIAPAVTAAGAVAGAYITADANSEAAEKAAAASRESAAVVADGNRQAQQRYEEMREDAQPGLAYLRTATLSPMQLTPLQQQQLTEAREQTNRNLSASGLSGSGRAQVAAQRQVESDLYNRFLESNQGRADRAAGQLAGQAYSAGAGAAQQGAAAAGAEGRGIREAGLVEAQGGIANAQLTGAAMGDIAGIIRDEIKSEGRRSKYGNDEA